MPRKDEGRGAGQRTRPSDCLSRRIDSLHIAPAYRIFKVLSADSGARGQLLAARRERRDPAPALAQAILERALLEDLGQAEIYRWIRGMWPTTTSAEMTRAFRIASELFAVDYLTREV